MARNIFRTLTTISFIIAILGIVALIFLPFPSSSGGGRTAPQGRLVTPRIADPTYTEASPSEYSAPGGDVTTKIHFPETDAIISVLNGNFYADPIEEQFVAYRDLSNPSSPVQLTFVGYDATLPDYKRMWTNSTSITRLETLSLYTQDLLGDGSVSVLVSGMNDAGEYTLTVFHMLPPLAGETDRSDRFRTIADLRTDGGITVKEVRRSQLYQLGLGLGESFGIVVSGRDFQSENLTDQIEVTYQYDTESGRFIPDSTVRIPGAQIAQGRLQEILSSVQSFESFISGLWFQLTPQGTIDRNIYMYFNPEMREIMFYDNGILQVFTWRNSLATRTGLYIATYNISLSNLRRAVDIQLESLSSIRIRLIEDIRPQFRGEATPWDGSYQKVASPRDLTDNPVETVTARINATYKGETVTLRFLPNGTFTTSETLTPRAGNYAFFRVNDIELLEFQYNDDSGGERETYVATRDQGENSRTMRLTQARIGTRGVEMLNEYPLDLTLVEE